MAFPSSTIHRDAILSFFLESFLILDTSCFPIGLVKFSRKTISAFFMILSAFELIPSMPEMPRPTNHNIEDLYLLYILSFGLGCRTMLLFAI